MNQRNSNLYKKKFEDTKMVIKNRKSKKDRQCNANDQKKKDKRTNTDLHRNLKINQQEPYLLNDMQ